MPEKNNKSRIAVIRPGRLRPGAVKRPGRLARPLGRLGAGRIGAGRIGAGRLGILAEPTRIGLATNPNLNAYNYVTTYGTCFKKCKRKCNETKNRCHKVCVEKCRKN